jgi:hypothetical protein
LAQQEITSQWNDLNLLTHEHDMELFSSSNLRFRFRFIYLYPWLFAEMVLFSGTPARI